VTTPSPSPRTALGWSERRTAERAPRLRLGGLRAGGEAGGAGALFQIGFPV